jgi:hypothetical protein
MSTTLGMWTYNRMLSLENKYQNDSKNTATISARAMVVILADEDSLKNTQP